jgi:hypothetical protein
MPCIVIVVRIKGVMNEPEVENNKCVYNFGGRTVLKASN